MTTDEFADIASLTGVVKRHRYDVLIGQDLRFGEEVGVVEIDTESRDDILDTFWRNQTHDVSCQRIRIADAGYRYQIFCPISWASLLFRELMEEGV